MTARVLIVDDNEINLRLMKARLQAEYFEVLTAESGAEAIGICASQSVDLVLLDVMMPDMDGYEVCRRLKRDPRTLHIPVVLVTALDQPSDRVEGLEAGADDFLTKPVRDLQLFSRVRSLVRLKLLTDELRGRAETTVDLVARSSIMAPLGEMGDRGRLLIHAQSEAAAARIAAPLRSLHDVEVLHDHEAVRAAAMTGTADLILIDLQAGEGDPLRLCSQLRSGEATRRIPILVVADAADEARTARALEIGATDYILRPIDRNELAARIRTQIRRRRYEEGLRRSVEATIELAIRDPLTGLHNRRFLELHLASAIGRADTDRRALSLLVADIDHFKRINDGWGHDAGDAALRQFADRLRNALRISDLACRYGGEEFVVLMPDTAEATAVAIAERLRATVAGSIFEIAGEPLVVTVSVGVATFRGPTDDAAGLLKRADQALYEAKRSGRNRVMTLAA
ncbi:PleD family two-component system response regulator [Mangrovicella endophytica]|uniref:PleD family two-component system response regulator n=1 Tax=Mangrovicella endophytica TaxID=2066697 RepID=UPI000C9E9666|nr:PleD family two-component system response regulator [Mangrovicella endophytica]